MRLECNSPQRQAIQPAPEQCCAHSSSGCGNKRRPGVANTIHARMKGAITEYSQGQNEIREEKESKGKRRAERALKLLRRHHGRVTWRDRLGRSRPSHSYAHSYHRQKHILDLIMMIMEVAWSNNLRLSIIRVCICITSHGSNALPKVPKIHKDNR